MDVKWNNLLDLWKTLNVEWNNFAVGLFFVGIICLSLAVRWREHLAGDVLSAVSTVFFYGMPLVVKKEVDILVPTDQKFEELNAKLDAEFNDLTSQIIALKNDTERVAAVTRSVEQKLPSSTKYVLKVAAKDGLKRFKNCINASLRKSVSKKFLKLKRDLDADVNTVAVNCLNKVKMVTENDIEVVTDRLEMAKIAAEFNEEQEKNIGYIPQAYEILIKVDGTLNNL